MKTNGARFLESLGIPFELREYEVDRKRSLRHHRRQKNRHARRAGLQNPADHRRRARFTSSPSSPATPSSTSKNSPAPPAGAKPRWLRSKTCSRSPATSAAASPSSAPRKPYPVFVDETAILFDKISVSAGTRGTQLILTPDDYLRAAAALDAPVQNRRPHQRHAKSHRDPERATGAP